MELMKKLKNSWMDLKGPVERLFLNDTAATAALERAGIPEQVNSFVTFASDPKRLKHWERSAQITVKPTGPEEPVKVEVDLHSLVRDFGACIAIPQLYGKDFLERYPQALEDLWKFDNDLFPLLMIGMPRWAPLKIMKEGLAARTRLIAQIEALYRRVEQHQLGKPIDFDADLSDISSAALERSKVYQRDGWSFPERGSGDLGTFWGQNANTQPVLFWLLTYVYSTAGLLSELREETAPYVKISNNTPRELTSLDIPGLSKSCQLLKACIYETYRHVNEPTSIRYVARPITIKDGYLNHQLQEGTFVSAPFAVGNHDPSVYADPEKFNPTRFLERDAKSGKGTARYGKMKPWGSGSAMCKGRTFAEKEILVLTAAIINMWDFAPANEVWKLPAMVPGTGVRKPRKDIRVVISKRQDF